MQAISKKHPGVTPDPFVRRRKLPMLVALALGLAIASPVHAADSGTRSRKHARPVLELKARKRLPARAKSAGPVTRLRRTAPALLTIEIVDRNGPSSKRIELELLVNNERTATLETQVDRDQYQLTVSPASTPGLLRIDVRRRGTESFQITTLVDPKQPALLSHVGSGSNHTEIRLLRMRPVVRAQRKRPSTRTP